MKTSLLFNRVYKKANIFTLLFISCSLFFFISFLIPSNDISTLLIDAIPGVPSDTIPPSDIFVPPSDDTIPTSSPPFFDWFEKLVEKIKNGTPITTIIIAFIITVLGGLIVTIIVTLVSYAYKMCKKIKQRRKFLKQLNEYKNRICNEYSTFGLPFDEDKEFSMKDSFINLSANKNNKEEVVHDISEFAKKNPYLVITGLPGSGKTLICRKLLYDCCSSSNKFTLESTISVLITLNNLTDKLERKLVFPIKDESFSPFIDKLFDEGLLQIIFDGFDEVKKDNQDVVKNNIISFMENNSNCKYIITCRNTVYNNEFNDFIKRKGGNRCNIINFGKKEVKKFIDMWLLEKEKKEGKKYTRSGEAIYAVLQKKTNLKDLMRNPLTLAMIMFLHVDKSKVLPQSRGEFYELLTQNLLDPESNNNSNKLASKLSYHKKLQLFSEIAFKVQTSKEAKGIREIPEELIEYVIKSLNIPYDNINDFIKNEIRSSGLIIKADNIYQFPHLTLQEYFVAYWMCKNNKEALLLSNFQENPKQWQEIIKLYCNISKGKNLTTLFLKIKDIDAIVALECLADAKNIDDGVTSDILNTYLKPIPDWCERTVKALALITSGLHSEGSVADRAKIVFEYLKSKIYDKNLSNDNMNQIVNTLAYSYTKEAVEIFIDHYFENEGLFHDAVKKMEDVRVPFLNEIANQYIYEITIKGDDGLLKEETYQYLHTDSKHNHSRNVTAVECLLRIGKETEGEERLDAFQALVTLLWMNDKMIIDKNNHHDIKRTRDTINRHVAVLLSSKEIIEELQKMDLNIDFKQDERVLDYVWEPFDTTKNSKIYYVMCRIAFLLNDCEHIPQNHIIHSRISIPLAINEYFSGKKDPEQLISSRMENDKKEKLHNAIEKEKNIDHETWIKRWINVLSKDYDFDKQKERKILLFIFSFLSILLLGLTALFIITSEVVLLGFIMSFALLNFIIYLHETYMNIGDEGYMTKNIKNTYISNKSEFVVCIIFFFVLCILGCLCIGISDDLTRKVFLSVFLFINVLFFIMINTAKRARRKKQESRNPLSEILENKYEIIY